MVIGSALRAQERGRRDSDSVVGASVCLASCRDDDGVEQIVSDLLAQPPEMRDVLCRWGPGGA
jgi:hypothetical protein